MLFSTVCTRLLNVNHQQEGKILDIRGEVLSAVCGISEFVVVVGCSFVVSENFCLISETFSQDAIHNNSAIFK